jgi:hypothetical protein
MSATGLSSKRAFCLAVVVAMIPSATFALAARNRQERLPAELSMSDAITIYLERNVDLPATRGQSRQIGASLSRRRGLMSAPSRNPTPLKSYTNARAPKMRLPKRSCSYGRR